MFKYISTFSFLALLAQSVLASEGAPDPREIRNLQNGLLSTPQSVEGGYSRVKLAEYRMLDKVDNSIADIPTAIEWLLAVKKANAETQKFGPHARNLLASMRVLGHISEDELSLRDARASLESIIQEMPASGHRERAAVIAYAQSVIAKIDELKVKPAPQETAIAAEAPVKKAKTEEEPIVETNNLDLLKQFDVSRDGFLGRVYTHYIEFAEDQRFREVVERDIERVKAKDISQWMGMWDGRILDTHLWLLSRLYNIHFNEIASGRHIRAWDPQAELIRNIRVSWNRDMMSFVKADEAYSPDAPSDRPWYK